MIARLMWVAAIVAALLWLPDALSSAGPGPIELIEMNGKIVGKDGMVRAPYRIWI